VKISCIIPTRNRCQSVLAALDSIKRQQFYELEIILVDDGSTDDTLAEVASLFPEVHTVKLSGVGPGLARNAGAGVAGGDILMFLDSDDLWLENHVKRLVNVLNLGFEVAYGVAQTRNEVGGEDFLIPENGTGLEGDCFQALTRWCFLVPSALAVTRKAFEHAGGFSSVPYGEDWLFFLELATLYPFGFTGAEPITLRKLHPGSLCFLSDKKKLLGIIKQVRTFLENEPRATVAHCHHFRMLHAWTSENSTHWPTVQDWYLSMLKEKII
jgi:glycosyltransferase involved in cell wall biosynthesis